MTGKANFLPVAANQGVYTDTDNVAALTIDIDIALAGFLRASSPICGIMV